MIKALVGSNSSASARTISVTATARGLAISRYISINLFIEQGLASCQVTNIKR
jgi:hypothetical protein